MLKFRKAYFLAFACLFIPPVGLMDAVHGQSATATLNVIIVDTNGAAVPSTNITVTNANTGIRREVTANNAGQAGITQLSPGRYTIIASRQGFEAAKLENIVLRVNDLLAVRVQLKVGEIRASVQVSDSGTAHNESSAVSMVVDHKFIENLPLNGRSRYTRAKAKADNQTNLFANS